MYERALQANLLIQCMHAPSICAELFSFNGLVLRYVDCIICNLLQVHVQSVPDREKP